jgi:hypothetical protein
MPAQAWYDKALQKINPRHGRSQRQSCSLSQTCQTDSFPPGH